MKDLTKGNEAKNILLFALPMLIGNIFQQLYSTIDGIIVGRFAGTEAQAAVSASFPIFFLLVSLIIGVTMGATVLISQYFGAEKMDKVKTTIDTTYIFLFIATAIITVTGLIFSETLLKILEVPENVFPQAKAYLNIIFIGMIVMFGYNSISAILRGLGDSKTPMYFLILSTFINIGLDLLFIVVFGWGVKGAAWATVIAQGCSFVFGIYHLNRSHRVFKLNIKKMKFDKAIFSKSLKIGLPTGVQQMLFAFGMMAISRIVNGFGDKTMAAYFAAGRIDTFASMPIMSLSAAVSTFTGQNLGAKKPERVKKGLKYSLGMAAVSSLVITLVLFTFRNQLISIFNKDASVIEIGARYLYIISPFYIVIGTSFIVTGLLRGAGDTIFPMVISIISLWAARYPVSKFFSQKIGTDGIWLGVPVGWGIGFILTFAYYATGKWKKKVAVGAKINISEEEYEGNDTFYGEVIEES